MTKTVTLTLEADERTLEALMSILEEAEDARAERRNYLRNYGHLDYEPEEERAIRDAMQRDDEVSLTLGRLLGEGLRTLREHTTTTENTH